jgi:cyclophilin family peptidyl-prolyl cis-trans isomerase
MPSDKRQRQDEGRLNRRVEMQSEAKKGQRRRQLRALAVTLVVLVGGAFLYSVFAGDDEDDPVATTDSSTSIPADDSVPDDSVPGDEVVPGDPTVGTADCAPVEGASERTTTFDSGPKGDCIDVTKTYTAEIETSRGTLTVELDAANAPKSVNNFVFLARHRYYEGVAFHRIIKGFMLQGGDANGNPPGSGGPGYQFSDEAPSGPPYYELGSLAMANSGPNTNGSQFFVVAGESGVNLAGNYNRFGKVVDGMDVVEAIEATGMDSDPGTPSEETTIESVTISEQ